MTKISSVHCSLCAPLLTPIQKALATDNGVFANASFLLRQSEVMWRTRNGDKASSAGRNIGRRRRARAPGTFLGTAGAEHRRTARDCCGKPGDGDQSQHAPAGSDDDECA